jgi:hypothetical protein
MPGPDIVVLAAASQELAYPGQHGVRPHQVPASQREQGVEVAPNIEARPLAGRQRQHEVRAHQIQHGRLAQAVRHEHASFSRAMAPPLAGVTRIRHRTG